MDDSEYVKNVKKINTMARDFNFIKKKAKAGGLREFDAKMVNIMR